MNLGSVFSAAAKLLPGAGSMLPTLGPAGLANSLLLDLLRNTLPSLLSGKAQAVPEAAAQVVIDRMTGGFLKGLGS